MTLDKTSILHLPTNLESIIRIDNRQKQLNSNNSIHNYKTTSSGHNKELLVKTKINKLTAKNKTIEVKTTMLSLELEG